MASRSNLSGDDILHLAVSLAYAFARGGVRCRSRFRLPIALVLELELIQTQMTQKPMLRAEVHARALRASQSRKEGSV